MRSERPGVINVAARQRARWRARPLARPQGCQQDAAQRLGRAPQQLVADGEGAEVLRAHRQFGGGGRPESSCVPVTATGVRSFSVASRVLGTTFTQALSAAIMASTSASGTSFFSLKVSAWLWQRIAPTRTQKPSTGGPPSRSLRPGRGSCWSRHALPFLARLAVAQVLVDPGDQRAAQRHAESWPSRLRQRALFARSPCGRSRGWRSSGRRAGLHLGVQRAELRQQFAHVLRAAARGGLVGLGAHPLDQAGPCTARHAHQHAADGAVAADPVAAAVGQRVLDGMLTGSRMMTASSFIRAASRPRRSSGLPAGARAAWETPRWCSRRPGR